MTEAQVKLFQMYMRENQKLGAQLDIALEALSKCADNKILSAMDSYLMQQKLLNPILIVEEGTQYRIKTEDIVYLEAIGKNCLIRTREHTYKSSKTLSKIEEVLPTHCFYRIHKSYIVNMYCIDSISKNEILMVNGEKTIISRNMLSTFKKTYSNFIKNFYLKV